MAKGDISNLLQVCIHYKMIVNLFPSDYWYFRIVWFSATVVIISRWSPVILIVWFIFFLSVEEVVKDS